MLAEQNVSIAEQRQAHAEERTADLFKRQERLEREVSPLQAAAEALREYAEGTRKPNKKDVPALAAELARTKTELQYSTKDQHGLFQELQQAERKNAELQRSADLLRELKAAKTHTVLYQINRTEYYCQVDLLLSDYPLYGKQSAKKELR